MSSTLSELLHDMEGLLAQVANPRIACERRCNRTLTLQHTHWDESADSAAKWSCDATAECGYGNEHFCRFPPLSADGYGDSPEEAATACASNLRQLLEERSEQLEPEEEDEEF